MQLGDRPRREGHEERPERGSREQQPDDLGPTVQLLHGDHRIERLRAPEDHRNQIDHERRLQEAMVAQVSQTLGERGDPALDDLLAQRDRGEQERDEQREAVGQEVNAIGPGRAEHRDHDARQGGSDDGADLPPGLVERRGSRDLFVGEQPRDRRLPRGPVDRREEPRAEVRGVQQPQGRMPGQRAEEQSPRDRHRRELGPDQGGASVVPIDERRAHGDTGEAADEARDAEESDRGGRPGQCVDLYVEADPRELGAHRRDDGARPKQPKLPGSQWGDVDREPPQPPHRGSLRRGRSTVTRVTRALRQARIRARRARPRAAPRRCSPAAADAPRCRTCRR